MIKRSNSSKSPDEQLDQWADEIYEALVKDNNSVKD